MASRSRSPAPSQACPPPFPSPQQRLHLPLDARVKHAAPSFPSQYLSPPACPQSPRPPRRPPPPTPRGQTLRAESAKTLRRVRRCWAAGAQHHAGKPSASFRRPRPGSAATRQRAAEPERVTDSDSPAARPDANSWGCGAQALGALSRGGRRPGDRRDSGPHPAGRAWPADPSEAPSPRGVPSESPSDRPSLSGRYQPGKLTASRVGPRKADSDDGSSRVGQSGPRRRGAMTRIWRAELERREPSAGSRAGDSRVQQIATATARRRMPLRESQICSAGRFNKRLSAANAIRTRDGPTSALGPTRPVPARPIQHARSAGRERGGGGDAAPPPRVQRPSAHARDRRR
jgi:hypothetical protein